MNFIRKNQGHIAVNSAEKGKIAADGSNCPVILIADANREQIFFPDSQMLCNIKSERRISALMRSYGVPFTYSSIFELTP